MLLRTLPLLSQCLRTRTYAYLHGDAVGGVVNGGQPADGELA